MLCAPSPLRVTIDCDSKERYAGTRSKTAELFHHKSQFDVNSFCDMIHKIIPKAVKDGKFIVESAEDQVGYSDTQTLRAVAPPQTFIPTLGFSKLKAPKLSVPKIKVPKLGIPSHNPLKPPSVGSAMSFPTFKNIVEEETSAERMEKFKKGVQKMLHVVKVLGQIDQYLSERTRIVVDKLSKTFAD
ncbi:uncharacterized protein [Epargyreus clarus]